MKLEDEVLYHLEKENTAKAKELLGEAVGYKALLIGICIEEKCVSDKTLSKINKKP